MRSALPCTQTTERDIAAAPQSLHLLRRLRRAAKGAPLGRMRTRRPAARARAARRTRRAPACARAAPERVVLLDARAAVDRAVAACRSVVAARRRGRGRAG